MNSSGSVGRRRVRGAGRADGTFKPNPVIDRLAGLTTHLEWFNVSRAWWCRRSPMSAPRCVADAANLDHPVLDALAGNPTAKWAVEESYAPVEPQPG